MHPILFIHLLLSWSFNFSLFSNHIVKCPPLPIRYSHIDRKRERAGVRVRVAIGLRSHLNTSFIPDTEQNKQRRNS